MTKRRFASVEIRGTDRNGPGRDHHFSEARDTLRRRCCSSKIDSWAPCFRPQPSRFVRTWAENDRACSNRGGDPAGSPSQAPDLARFAPSSHYRDSLWSGQRLSRFPPSPLGFQGGHRAFGHERVQSRSEAKQLQSNRGAIAARVTVAVRRQLDPQPAKLGVIRSIRLFEAHDKVETPLAVQD